MARTFDGTNDKVDFGNNTATDLTTCTICSWVKFSANFTAERIIVSRNKADLTQTKQYLQSFGTLQNDLGTYMSRATTASQAGSAVNQLVANVWNLCIATHNSGTNAPKLYHCTEGNAPAEVTYNSQVAGSGAYGDTSTGILDVAARSSVDAVFWNGQICESAMWNRVLTAAEIATLGLGASPLLIPSGLVWYAPLEGQLSPEPDLSVTGLSGTVTEATSATHKPIYRFQQARDIGHGLQVALGAGLNGVLIQ